MTSFILGTAQFGLAYGITNSAKKIQKDNVFRMLEKAAEHGITYLDTAPAYGDAETVLGEYEGLNQFNIISKSSDDDGDYVEQAEATLGRLGRPMLDLYLTHGADALCGTGAEERFAGLKTLKERGLARRIGASVYTLEQIDFICGNFDVDVLQVPLNIFDQRLIVDGTLGKIASRGIAVHARSIFLQGLLLSSAQDLPEYFAPISKHLEAFDQFCQTHAISRLDACCGFIKAQFDHLDGVLFGVHTEHHLDEICTAFKTAPLGLDYAAIAYHGKQGLDPRDWPS